MIYASLSKLFEELKNVITIWVRSAVLSYWSKHAKYCFGQQLKNSLAYQNFNVIFLVSLTICFKMHISFSKKKNVGIFEISPKFWFGPPLP